MENKDRKVYSIVGTGRLLNVKVYLDDKLVYDLFCTADTDGIFQFETPTFKNMLIKYQPKNFNELVASIALVRPGPKVELASYIKRKNKQEQVTYYHENLKDILEETYGIIVYQEQVISILVKMASFTYAEADNIRRAMSKKKMDLILKQKDEFIKRSIKNGYDQNLANNIFDHILNFASYGFNKSHSVSYAIISYQMAYLKVHYKTLFVFEQINSAIGSIEQIKKYLAYLKQNGIKIKPVNINKSTEEFVLENNILYLPFKLIKNIKSDLIKNILNDRANLGSYKDIFDFYKRTSDFINKNEYIMLINAGAFNNFNYNNQTLIKNIDEFINYGKLSKDLGEYALVPNIKEEKEYDIDVLRLNEINSYGFFISNHPASKQIGNNIMKMINIKENTFKNVYLYVMIDDIKRIKTKKNEDMAFIKASDETGEGDLTLFPQNFYMLENLKNNDMIKVWGKVSKRFDKYSIIISRLERE